MCIKSSETKDERWAPKQFVDIDFQSGYRKCYFTVTSPVYVTDELLNDTGEQSGVTCGVARHDKCF